MTNRRKINRGRGHQRHLSVRAVRKETPDLRKLSRAVLQYAMEQAAAEAAAQAEANKQAGEQPEKPDA